jgi:hypothetical protein
MWKRTYTGGAGPGPGRERQRSRHDRVVADYGP